MRHTRYYMGWLAINASCCGLVNIHELLLALEASGEVQIHLRRERSHGGASIIGFSARFHRRKYEEGEKRRAEGAKVLLLPNACNALSSCIAKVKA
jgi:hypothetical protein